MKKLQGSKRKETKKSPGSKRKTMTMQMPSAFELAVLAAGFTGGNLHSAFHSYLSASYYLKTNGLAELALWEGALSEEKVEAFVKLTSGGALDRGRAVVEYKKLVSGLKPGLKLYKDKRDDAVKSAIRAVTDHTCNYQTARDHLKKAWLLKPSRYTSAELKISTNGSNAWDRWCDANTKIGQDKKRYLSIPGVLVEAALCLLCCSRGISLNIAESALRSAAAVEHAIEHPPPSAEEQERQKQWVEDFEAASSVGRSDDLVQLRENRKWPKKRDIDWLKKARSERISALART